MLRDRLRPAAALLALVFGLVLLGDSSRLPSRRWSFLEQSDLADLHASLPAAGPWSIEDHAEATGARALVNREGTNGAQPAVLVAKSILTRDLTASTRCKSTAQCGLVFRYRNDDNYDVARFDAASQSIILAAVAGGHELVLARAPVDENAWHDLRVDASAGLIRVRWGAKPNDRLLIEATEGAPANSGYAGLWVPANATAYFDELSIEALPDSPRALEVLPLLGGSSG